MMCTVEMIQCCRKIELEVLVGGGKTREDCGMPGVCEFPPNYIWNVPTVSSGERGVRLCKVVFDLI
jgi:hypothetical protein